MNRFQSTVSALCYSILRERCPAPASEFEFPNNQVVRFVLEQHGRMAEFLRIPLVLVTLAFDLSSILRHGRSFHRLPHEARWRQVEAWRNARPAVCRDFVRFYESFVIFYCYSTHAPSWSEPLVHSAAPTTTRTAA